jgi:hypothetical protein
MPKTPREDRKKIEEADESPDKDRWSEDQKERGYYYDDAHGYEKYVEDEDEDEEARDAEARA